jgi:myo-inositol catabolism protein IolS
MNKQIALGKTKLKASRIGFGAGVVGNEMMYPSMNDEKSLNLMQAVLTEDIQMIDTAYMYGQGKSEELIGEIIHKQGVREKLIISTKVSPNFEFIDGQLRVDNSPQALRKAVEESLNRLQTDYIDILYLHYPYSNTPLAESAAALAELKKQGKIKAIGASNLNYQQLQAFNQYGDLDVLQTEYSLLARQAEEEIIPYSLAKGISVIPFFPLASGLLAGKYKKDQVFTDLSRMNNSMFQGTAYTENIERVEQFKLFAEKKGAAPAQIALAWLLTRPSVDLIIPGATRPDQLISNLSALNIKLDPADLAELDSIFPS